MKRGVFSKFYWLFICSFFCIPFTSKAYSVLTHEAIVDALWEKSMRPLLILHYPGVSEVQLKAAHAYAYGGSIAPDMGYFPFGSRLFTDLVHYVRSGDFTDALLNDATDVNEYAFALGFLCHYMADKSGHFIATNRCVPIVYPSLKLKFGDVVTYAEDKVSHKRTEFAFDVLQTAKGNYASQAYHDFIGFSIPRSLLERAFRETYGLELSSVFVNFSLAVNTLRWSVMSLLPVLTRSAWVIKKDEILTLQPTATSRTFRYKMNKANYYQEPGKRKHNPGIFANVLSWLIRVLPKIGPLQTLKIVTPGPVAEKLFIQSFDSVLVSCSSSMNQLSAGNIKLSNIDFDTGIQTAPGEYKLADIAYGSLLVRLRKKDFNQTNTALRNSLLEFYSNPQVKLAAKNGRQSRIKIARALAQLRNSRAKIL